jgi:hypothetical protein
MFLKHFCIAISAIGGIYSAFADNWQSAVLFVIALLLNGIYLIDDRIKELKKNEGGK